MRVTHNLIADRLLTNLWRTERQINKLHDQGASAKRVNAPSDDPVATKIILRYRSGLAELSRYESNANDAGEWLAVTDQSIMSLYDALHRIEELAVQGANSSLSEGDRYSYVTELDEIIDHMVVLGNTAISGRYVFGGHETLAPPFSIVRDDDGTISTVAYRGSVGDIDEDPAPVVDEWIRREIGQGSYLTINVLGNELFGYGKIDPREEGASDGPPNSMGQGVFRVALQIRQAIADGQVDEISERLLAKLNDVHEQVASVQVKVSATINRAEQGKGLTRGLMATTQTLLSVAEGADMAEVIMRLNSAEASYRYALAVGARIIQPTLVDYLR